MQLSSEAYNFERASRRAMPGLGMPGLGMSRRAGKVSAAPSTPLTIISSVSVLQWVRADLGVHLTSGNVDTLNDQSGNNRHFSQGTAANQPTYTASDATLNNQATFTCDGATRQIASTSFAQADPVWVWLIFKLVTWGANRRVWCANQASNTPTIFMTGSSPAIAQNATSTVNSNSGAVLASWRRGEFLFSSSTGDYIKIGATLVTGASAGATTIASGVVLGGAFSAGVTGNVAFAEYALCAGKPNAGELTALDAYVTSRYGAGLT